MNNVIEVLFVVPKNYLDYATAISEELSKQENFVSKCYEVKEFQSKAIPESVNRFFVLLGDAKENKISKKIIMDATSFEKEPGIFIATYKSYAVIFGESNYSFKDSLKDSWKTLGNITSKTKEKILPKNKFVAGTIVGASIGVGANVIATGAILSTSILSSPTILGIGIAGGVYLNTKRKKIKQENTKIALAKFFKEIFSSWITNETE